jgi:DNA repair exonuclease SbcCD ATPase subunit
MIARTSSASPPSFESFIARGYKQGSIVRVAMRNFLTYDNAEAFPGPHLNVVLGPNGSGKSALTHAICLACGGSPASIGRSDDITQFVKRGKASEGIAYCEVDILTHESIRTVRRVIQSDSRTSKWYMNGRTSSQAEVKHLMRGMNIDVDNICSFMPQDKVGSFTQLSPQGVLQKTLQSIEIEGTACAQHQPKILSNSSSSSRTASSSSSLQASVAASPPATLYDEQMALAKFQADARQRENEIAVKRRTIETLQRAVQSMQADVDRMRQRSELQETRRMLLVKEAVVEAEDAQAQLQTCIVR